MQVDPSFRIYLSGPITGHTKRAIRAWRTLCARHLSGIAKVIDPTSYIFDSEVAFVCESSPAKELNRLQLGRNIVGRNKVMIESCNLVLANVLGAGERASIGTVAEIFTAATLGKPIIIIREAHGNVHDHAMVNAVVSRVCHTLEDAITEVTEWANPTHRAARQRKVRYSASTSARRVAS
jgi:nucleoside 2-deoxyribosyltransferase